MQGCRAVDLGEAISELSSAGAANEGRVIVVQFARDTLRAGLGDEFHLADKISTPGLIDAGAEFAFDGFELFLPSFAIHSDFEAAGFATDRARVRREHLADDAWPASRKPGERRIASLESLEGLTENFAGLLHGAAILT